MRFKGVLIILGTFILSACGGSSSWFGEDPAKPPELKVRYEENDSETIRRFEIISLHYQRFLEGKLDPDGFLQMINSAEELLAEGISHIELQTKDSFTTEEITKIINSGVLRGEDTDTLERWVKRFTALARVLYGSETDAITMKKISEVFRRIRQIAPDMSKLSILMDKQNKVSSKESPEGWAVRREIFVKLFDIARTILKDNEAPLVKEILLHQQPYFDLGIRQEVWDRFVKACFIVNKAILGHSEDKIESRDIHSILNILDMTFQKVFDVYGVYAKKVWTPKEWALIIKRYEELLAKFLDAFSEGKAQDIKAQDLSSLLSLVHVGTQEEADTFVSALVDLKANIFQSPGSSFSRQDVKELRQFLHQAIEEVPEEGESELSTLLLHFIDHVIHMHDENKDGKLSVYLEKSSQKGEVVYKELSALIFIAKKMVAGFKKLMGESDFLNSLSQVGADTLGKIVIAVSDNLFVRSDQDGKLSRDEILELLNFVTEADQLASLLYWNDSLSSSHTQVLGEEAVFGSEWMKHVYRNSDFRNYFPRLKSVFLNPEDFREYVKQYLALFHKDESHPVTMRELKMILGLMKFVEYIFLKFDRDQDNHLSKNEIEKAYALFDSLMKEVVVHLKATGQGASFLDVHWLRVWWEIGQQAAIRKAV